MAEIAGVSNRRSLCRSRRDRQAFEWLQISFDNHDGGTLSLSVDPLLRDLVPIRATSVLLAKLGLPAANEQETVVLHDHTHSK